MIRNVIFIACLLLASCHATVNSYQKSDPTAKPQFEWVQKVITDRSLARNLQVQSVFVEKPSGLLTIQANVFNAWKSDINFLYQVEWFDAQGMLVYDPASTWLSMKLYGGQLGSIRVTATSPKAADWRLNIKSL